MHIQVLGSGSGGNATLVRAGELHVLIDAGLVHDVLHQRFEAARVSPRRLDHILITHGHLDHARCAGRLARRTGAHLLCAESIMRNAALRRAARHRTIRLHEDMPLARDSEAPELFLRAVPIPHDADPTYAFRLEHHGRRMVSITDMGSPVREVAQALHDAHLLVLEFNHDTDMLARGPYSPALRRRVGGPRGHLSNEQASEMLRMLAGPELHTLVLAHISQKNNTPELALAAAQRTLEGMGLEGVRVLVAEQDSVGPNLAV